MHKRLLFLVPFILCSCRQPKAPPAVLDTSKMIEHPIGFLEASLWLSPNFELISLEEMTEMIKSEEHQAFEFPLKSGATYKNMEPIFFKDQLASETIIVVYPMPYQPIDKQTASMWISGMISSMNQADSKLGRTSEIVEKKMKKFGSHQMVTFKTRQTDVMGNHRYFAQYYISGNLNSFMILHSDIFNKDIEANLKLLLKSSK